MHRGMWVWLGVITLLLGACGDPDAVAPRETPATAVQPTLDTSLASTTSEAVTAASTPLDDVVFPSERGGWDGDPLVECEGVVVPLSTFSSLPPLASNQPDLRAAIEESAALMGDPALATEDWLVLTHDADTVRLIAFVDDRQSSLELHRSDGRWTFGGGGTGGTPCTLQTVMPPSLGVVEWIADPAHPTSPDDTELHLLVHEAACASGQPLGERLLGPRVMETDSEVRITFATVPLDGDQTCPSNPEESVVVPLSAPLGERTVLEGRTVGSVLAWLPFEGDGPENVTLHVSNQSFADALVHITVTIDGTTLVDQPFDVGSQHNWIPFELPLEAGSHELVATSDTGVTSTFSLDVAEAGHTYAVLNYWYYPPDPKYPGATQTPRSFDFMQQDEPIYFE